MSDSEDKYGVSIHLDSNASKAGREIVGAFGAMVRAEEKVTGASRKMDEALDGVAASARSAGSAAASAKAGVSGLGDAMARGAAQAEASAGKYSRAASAMRDMGKAATAAEHAAASASSGVDHLGMPISRSISDHVDMFGMTRSQGFSATTGATPGAHSGVSTGGDHQRGIDYFGSGQVGRRWTGGEPQVRDVMQGPILNRRAQNLGISQHIGNAAKELKDWNSQAGEGIQKWRQMSATFMATPFGMVLRGLGGIVSGLVDLGVHIAQAVISAGQLTLALGAIGAVMFTKKVVEMSALAESSRLAFKYLTGSVQGSKDWMAASIDTARDLGMNVEETLDSFKSLRAQQFALGQAKDLVRMSADLVTVTGHADAASRSIRAITQIKSAGRLQGDELNQLAEAGVSRDLIYAELEKSLHTNRAGVMAAQSSGDIDAATAIDAIQKAIAIKLHTKSPGDAAKKAMETTLTGMWTSLKNLPDLIFLEMGEKIDKGPLVASLKLVRDAIIGVSQGPMIGFVNSMVQSLSNLIPLTIDFARGFGSGLDRISEALTGGETDLKQYAYGTGESLADFFANAVKGAKWLIREVPPAIESFMNGVNTSGLLASLKDADWSQLAQDFVAIAGALGKIAGYAAELAKFITMGPDKEHNALGQAGGKNGNFLPDLNAFADAYKDPNAQVLDFGRAWDKTLEMFGIGPETQTLAGGDNPAEQDKGMDVRFEVLLTDGRPEVKTSAKGRGVKPVNVSAGPLGAGSH